MKSKTKYLGTIGFLLLMLIVSSTLGSALDNTMEFRGNVYIGGVAATAGTVVTVEHATTGEQFATYTTTSGNPNYYILTITVTNTDSSSDGKAYADDPLKFKVNGVVTYTPASGAWKANYTGGTPDIRTNVDLNTTPSCTDGVKNQDEEDVDCGGETCTPCYAISATPESDSETLEANGSGTFTLTIKNVGYKNLTGITLTTSTGCNITITFSKNNFALYGSENGSSTNGESTTVTVNKTIGDLPDGTYSCTITVKDSTEEASDTVSVTVNVGAVGATTTYVRRKYFDVTYAPETPVAGQCITLTVMDRNSGNTLKGAEVDIFLNGKKVFYGNTDKDGKFEFCPTKAGKYEVQINKARYREEIVDIEVLTGAPTTTVPPVTTTVPPVTTTVPPAPTTTVPPVTTTVPPAPQPVPMTTWLIVLIVVIIIIAIIYLVTKKKKEEREEEEEGAAGEEEEEKGEEEKKEE
jgi:hypothetical protein